MLEMDPTKRATAQEMLDHPWLEGVGRTGEEVIVVGVLLHLWLNSMCPMCISHPGAMEMNTTYDCDSRYHCTTIFVVWEKRLRDPPILNSC